MTSPKAPGALKRARRDVWTAEEDAALLRLFPVGGWYAVHEATGRPKTGIRSRAHALGAQSPGPEVMRELVKAAAIRRYGPPSDRVPAHVLKSREKQAPASPPPTPSPPGPRHQRYMKADGRSKSDHAMPRVASVFELGEALA